MKAMILAAGLGTRLRPSTNDRPKALVEIAGHPLLEITLRRLASFGIREVIINVHHFADMVIDYLQRNHNFGLRVEISREDDLLLDTGGGLKKAAWFFLEGHGQEPFLLHNVDVISTIDLARMLRTHRENNALATLAVQQRQTSRRLLFDAHNQLCGRQTGNDPPEMVRHASDTTSLAFSGIHVISPDFLAMMSEQGVFSIITTYLRLAAESRRILGFRADEYDWRDLGKPEHITQAAADIASGVLTLP
ncbi:MAG TPA: nucleotidyltransferase family protein [Candidatus Sulfotelmatobacter sp.]|nr:nucleotidyltransferase family protein [Candidatus Sulfotelmatobacter sp.]